MLRSLLVALCRFLLRIFFRRIEVVGLHRLPEEGSVLFALNHPSGLVDPLFILCLSGRRVSFLAKEPLFRMPVIGLFVRAFECLPVYRSEDGADPEKNRAMMRAASDLLARGNALALFPEGTSHSDTNLKRFRSGAARIALSARALGAEPVRIVPSALYYEKKQTFRSRAVLCLGTPIDVPKVELDDAGEAPQPFGHELTNDLRCAIEALMPTADSADILMVAERAERVLSAAVRDSPDECGDAARALLPPSDESERLTLAARMARRRRLLDEYFQLVDVAPERVHELISAILRLSDELEAIGLPVDAAPMSAHIGGRKFRLLLLGGMLAPLATIGILMHMPAYQMVRYIAFRYSGGQADVTATVKLLAGVLFFPITWSVVGCLVGASLGTASGAAAALFAAALGYITIATTEIWGSVARSFSTFKRARRAGLDWPSIVKRRTEIVREMAQLAAVSRPMRPHHSPRETAASETIPST